VLAELFGVRGLGGLVGLVYTGGGIGALVGPPLAGVLVGCGSTGATAAGLFGLGAFWRSSAASGLRRRPTTAAVRQRSVGPRLAGCWCRHFKGLVGVVERRVLVDD
jgi:MFS family permease